MTFDDSCGCDPQDEGQLAASTGDGRFMLSRRKLLGGMLGAGIVTVVGSSPASAALRALATPGANDDRVLINIFLRGGADALNIVVPYGDSDYYRHRSSIALQRSSLTDLDGFFGLNRAFEPLHGLYRSGEAAFIHAAGSPTPEGSHFAAMDNIDFAFGRGGWMERALTVAQQTSPVSALTISNRAAPALQGRNGGVAFSRLDRFRRSSRDLNSMRSALESMYRANGDPLTAAATLKAFAAVDTLSAVSASQSTGYPNGQLSAQLREAAALIKADIGVRMIAVNYGGWDHHSNESARMDTVGAQLSGALAAFQRDLGSAKSRVMTVVMSEFGRTARENGSGGTDHGYGSLMTVVGSGLTAGGGGRVHLKDNSWVGLSSDKLDRDRNLDVTTDFRAVINELLENHMGIVDDGRIFPGYTPQPVGLFSAGSSRPPENRPTPEDNTNPDAPSTTQDPNPGTQAPDTQPSGTQAPSRTADASGNQGSGRTTSSQGSTTQGSTGGSGTQGSTASGNGASTGTGSGGSSSSAAGQSSTTGQGAGGSGSGGSNAAAAAGDKPAPLVVTAQNGSTASTAAGSAGATAAPAAGGATSTTAAASSTSAASSATTAPNLALSSGVQQTTPGGLGLGKVAPFAAAGTVGAAAVAGGLAWRKREQADPLVYLSADAEIADTDVPEDESWT